MAAAPPAPLVLVTEPLVPAALAWLAQRCDVECLEPGAPGFVAALARADALVVRTHTVVDEALLAAAPRLRVVGRAGVGTDNIDSGACARRGIVVLNTPDANTQAVVEYVLCLLCDALRPRTALTGPVDRAEWQRLREEVVGRRQIGECTVGVLGLGRIGSRIAEVARAIGSPVLYHDLLEFPPERRMGAEPVGLRELFSRSDVLTIHVDGRPSNRGLVGAELLSLMRPDAILVNTSRGLVVDHDALAVRLRAAPAALALIDVHEPEPVPAANPLLGLPNARLFPHLASRTDSAMANMSWVVRDVAAALGCGAAGAALRTP